MYNLESIFPTFLHHLQTDISKELLDFCYQLRDEDPVGKVKSNRGGWQSESFLPNDTLGSNIIKSVLSKTTEAFFQVPTLLYWWVNINKPNSYNVKHDHPGSDMSGVIWVKVPENSGNLYFPHNNYFCRLREIENSKPFAKQGFGHEVKPQAGNVILFPSCLQHEVTRNKSDEERISISFNSWFVDDVRPFILRDA